MSARRKIRVAYSVLPLLSLLASAAAAPFHPWLPAIVTLATAAAAAAAPALRKKGALPLAALGATSASLNIAAASLLGWPSPGAPTAAWGTAILAAACAAAAQVHALQRRPRPGRVILTASHGGGLLAYIPGPNRTLTRIAVVFDRYGRVRAETPDGTVHLGIQEELRTTRPDPERVLHAAARAIADTCGAHPAVMPVTPASPIVIPLALVPTATGFLWGAGLGADLLTATAAACWSAICTLAAVHAAFLFPRKPRCTRQPAPFEALLVEGLADQVVSHLRPARRANRRPPGLHATGTVGPQPERIG